MNGFCKTTLTSAIVALFCFGISTAQAFLYISGVHMFADDGATNCTSEADLLCFAVEIADDADPVPEIRLAGTPNPTLTFNLGGVSRTAAFDRVGSSLEGEGSFLYFVYAPSSTDYATGVTLKTGSTSFDRKAINITGSLVIRNANTSDTLDISGQYPASVPTAFNSEPYNMAMEVNMTSWSRHNRPRA